MSRDNWSLSFGTFNPNEDEEERQGEEYTKQNGIVGLLVIPDELDETRLKRYRLDGGVENNSFTFKVLEVSPLPITFSVMWIKHEEGSDLDYEDILSYWQIFLDYEF